MLPDLAKDADPQVQLQVLSLATPENTELQTAANAILARHMSDPVFRSAALSAAAGRELELLQSMLADPALAKADEKQKDAMYNDLAECVIRGRSAERIDKLFELIAGLPAAHKADRQAMLAGVTEAISPDPKSKAPKRKLRLPAEPAGLAKLKKSSEKKIVELASTIDAAMTWPNKPGDTTPPLKPLTDTESKRFAAGRELYSTLCGVCHQPSGLGMEGVAPPLLDSEWALGPPTRNIRIVLNGLTGPVKIGKKTFDSEMPGLKTLDDEQIASVLTYVRREWGHEGSPIDPKQVADVRKETETRGDQQWMADELLKVK
jgi:mono/diheme cytochrome c family protein